MMRTTTTMLSLVGIILLVLLAHTAVCAAEVVVIANNDVPADSIDRDTVASIYLGKKTKWNGHAICVGMLREGATHETFVKDVVRTTPQKLRRLWKKVVFAGRGRPPKIFKTEEELIQFVASNAGAVGYANPSASSKGVKVIYP